MNMFLLAALSALLPCFLQEVVDTLEISSVLEASAVVTRLPEEHLPLALVSLDETELRSGEPSASLPQRLSMLPSVVSLSEGGTGVGYTSFSVRGVSGYHTNVTLNGIALGDSESQEVFWVNIPGLSEMLSSVQLQRGLGTAACGPGAFGASLNMTTSPSEVRSAGISAGYGSFGTWSATVRGFTGLTKRGFFADAALNGSHTDGYIRNAPANVGSVFCNFGWKSRNDIVQAVMVQGWQRSAITWNGVPFDIYPVDRRFNVSEGDTDNYRQSHFQLSHRHTFGIPLVLNTVANYTSGYGWYDLGGNKDYLGNNLWVLRSELFCNLESLSLNAVAYLSHYRGLHWDEPYSYSDTARKSEADLSLRFEWDLRPSLSLFGEIQYRGVYYDLYLIPHRWNFCNPRFGANWSPSSSHKVYAFIAEGHREPARADFDSNPDVLEETLLDYELGYEYESAGFSASLNLYAMEYRDMLLETGNLNSQGYAVRENVSRAHRRGVETAVSYRPSGWLQCNANWSLSDNRYGDGAQLLLSPPMVAATSVALFPKKEMEFRLEGKYVARQFYNNTGLVPEYSVFNLSASRTFPLRNAALVVSAYLNNVLNAKYYAYAYNFGVFPAATRNGSIRLTLEF